MKRIMPVILCFVLLISLAACGTTTENTESTTATSQNESTQTPDTSTPTEPEQTVPESTPVETEQTENKPTESSSKTLVVYFSWSGNTGEMAQSIAEQTDGDIFEIVPVNAYPDDYSECTEVALVERDENARPEIQDLPESLDGYDRIFIGYPIWWHTAPMIIGTFLEHYDLTDIDVYPFTQSASMNEEQFEQSMEFVRTCAGTGTVHDGLFARSSDSEATTEYISSINN